MPEKYHKILIIRFSSLGDIAQAFASAQLLKAADPSAVIHWVTRSDFHDFVFGVPSISHVWQLRRAEGFRGLVRLGLELRAQKFDLIYDAHSNMRSYVLSVLLWRPGIKLLRRPKERIKRFLLFTLRRNTFENPYRGAWSFVNPLRNIFAFPAVLPAIEWQPRTPAAEVSDTILFAPSAAWELKKWPSEYWRELIGLLPNFKIGLLGGPEDHFDDLVAVAPDRVRNFAGKMNWTETTQAIYDCKLVVSADTGALHIADNFNKKAIALIGPTAFGFPSRPNSKVLEVELWCRPCTKEGRSKCFNPEFKKCLKDIRPAIVAAKVQELLQ